ATKASSPSVAEPSGTSRRIEVPGSPISRPPRASTKVPRVMTKTSPRLLGVVQGLEHLVGDVEPGVDVGGLLHDQVVLLGLGHLLEHAVDLFQYLLQTLIAPQRQVLLELALLA